MTPRGENSPFLGIQVEMLVNPPGSEPERRRVVWRRQSPVLGSLWKPPGEGVVLVLVNIHREPVEFSASLKPSRMGSLGRRSLDVAGRTFSADSDASAGALRVAGSEVHGRLPPHAVFLVSAR